MPSYVRLSEHLYSLPCEYQHPYNPTQLGKHLLTTDLSADMYLNF